MRVKKSIQMIEKKQIEVLEEIQRIWFNLIKGKEEC
jgi:hypothetical protein